MQNSWQRKFFHKYRWHYLETFDFGPMVSKRFWVSQQRARIHYLLQNALRPFIFQCFDLKRFSSHLSSKDLLQQWQKTLLSTLPTRYVLETYKMSRCTTSQERKQPQPTHHLPFSHQILNHKSMNSILAVTTNTDAFPMIALKRVSFVIKKCSEFHIIDCPLLLLSLPPPPWPTNALADNSKTISWIVHDSPVPL